MNRRLSACGPKPADRHRASRPRRPPTGDPIRAWFGSLRPNPRPSPDGVQARLLACFSDISRYGKERAGLWTRLEGPPARLFPALTGCWGCRPRFLRNLPGKTWVDPVTRPTYDAYARANPFAKKTYAVPHPRSTTAEHSAPVSHTGAFFVSDSDERFAPAQGLPPLPRCHPPRGSQAPLSGVH